MRACLALPLLAACLLMLPGCGPSNEALDPQTAARRAQYLLAEEPTGAQGVLDLREAFAAQQPVDEVVVVGLIGGIDPPWTDKQAAFVIADPFLMVEGHHECEGCAFCSKQDNNDGLALVEFRDETGNVLPIDSRRLFDLTERQAVVVRGRASLSPAGMLVVAAEGLYIRR